MDLRASSDANPVVRPWSRLVLLTLTLVVGLMLGAPLVRSFVRLIGVPIPYPLLVGVGLTGLAYAAVVARERAWALGGVVALVVLATFNADVPFMAAANEYPKAIVGRILLVQVPLAYLCVVAVVRGWYRESTSVPVYLLAGFVAASVLAALFGVRSKFVPAGFFVLYAAQLVLVFWFVETAIVRNIVTPRQVAAVLLLTVVGHSVVGLAQLVHHGPFGLTYLGEGGAHKRVWMALPVVGKFSIGPYIAGFTGMSFTLSIFCTAVVPIAAGMAYRNRDWRRVALVASLVVLVAMVRFSTADSARGALLLTLVAYGGLLAILARKGQFSIDPSRRLLVGAACLVVVLVAIVALPSMASHPSQPSHSVSGSASPPTSGLTNTSSRITVEPQTSVRASHAAPATTTPNGTDENAGGHSTETGSSKNISIPLFSTANLGTRLRQYAVAFDVFFSHPLVGIGGMNFVHVAGAYGLPVPDGYTHPRLIHNTYLALLTETGVLGFSLYVGAMAVVGYYGWRLLHERSATPLLISGILAGLVGIAAFSFWNPELYNVKVTFVFWILAGVVSGTYRMRRP